MASRGEVYAALDSERDYQESRRVRDGSTAEGREHSAEEWLIYMNSYLREANEVAARVWGPECTPRIMEIVRKVTALGVAAMEACGAPQRVGFPRDAQPYEPCNTLTIDDGEIPF